MCVCVCGVSACVKNNIKYIYTLLEFYTVSSHFKWCISFTLTADFFHVTHFKKGKQTIKGDRLCLKYQFRSSWEQFHWRYYRMKVVIGIDHDTVCAGVVGTAIRHSTSCAGRRTAACGRADLHNECRAGLQYQPRQRKLYKWSISILPRSSFYKKQGKHAFSTSCTVVRPHRHLRNDAWRRDS